MKKLCTYAAQAEIRQPLCHISGIAVRVILANTTRPFSGNFLPSCFEGMTHNVQYGPRKVDEGSKVKVSFGSEVL